MVKFVRSVSTMANSPFGAQPSSENSARQDHPLFTSSDSATIFLFLQSNVVNLAPSPQSRAPGPLYLCPPVTVWPSYTLTSLFVAFYDSHGYGEGILRSLHTGRKTYQVTKHYSYKTDIQNYYNNLQLFSCLNKFLPEYLYCLIPLIHRTVKL
jgi:hypothetical protein